METVFEGKKGSSRIKDPLRRVIKKVEDSRVKKVKLSQKAIFASTSIKKNGKKKKGKKY